MFNPKIKDWLKEHDDQTIIGFFWSIYWRFLVAVYGTILAVYLALALIGVVFG